MIRFASHLKRLLGKLAVSEGVTLLFAIFIFRMVQVRSSEDIGGMSGAMPGTGRPLTSFAQRSVKRYVA